MTLRDLILSGYGLDTEIMIAPVVDGVVTRGMAHHPFNVELADVELHHKPMILLTFQPLTSTEEGEKP